MNKLLVLFICISTAFMLIFADETSTKKKIEIIDIPAEVMTIAKDKVKGFEAKNATSKEEKDGLKFEIKGSANAKNIEVVVKLEKNGKITRVETEIILDVKDTPKDVLAAAKEKVKGFDAIEVEVKEEISGKEGKEYEIKGKADGKDVVVEIKVDQSGKVIKVEIEIKTESSGDGD